MGDPLGEGTGNRLVVGRAGHLAEEGGRHWGREGRGRGDGRRVLVGVLVVCM